MPYNAEKIKGIIREQEEKRQNILTKNEERYAMLQEHAKETLHDWIIWGSSRGIYEPSDKKELLKKGLCPYCAVEPIHKWRTFDWSGGRKECHDCYYVNIYSKLVKKYSVGCECNCREYYGLEECWATFPSDYAREIMNKSPEKFTKTLNKSDPFFTCSTCQNTFCEEGMKIHICLRDKSERLIFIPLQDKFGNIIGHPYGCRQTGRLYTYSRKFGRVWLKEKILEGERHAIVKLEVDDDFYL